MNTLESINNLIEETKSSHIPDMNVFGQGTWKGFKSAFRRKNAAEKALLKQTGSKGWGDFSNRQWDALSREGQNVNPSHAMDYLKTRDFLFGRRLGQTAIGAGVVGAGAIGYKKYKEND